MINECTLKMRKAHNTQFLQQIDAQDMLELNLMTKASFSLLSLTFSLYIFLSISLSCSKYPPFYWTKNTAKLIHNKTFACNLFKCVLIFVFKCFRVLYHALIGICVPVSIYQYFALLKMHLIIIGNNILIGFVTCPTIQPHHNLTHIELWFVKGIIDCIASVQIELKPKYFLFLFETCLSFLIWTALYNPFGCNRVRFKTIHVYVSFSLNLENAIYPF